MKEIILNSEKYPNKIAIVDDDMFAYLNQWKWYAAKRKHTFYAMRSPKRYAKVIGMHREIMGIKNNLKLFADHIDKNGLNNQKSNLRIANRSQNNANKIAKGKSKYLGVVWCQRAKKWQAQITKNYKVRYLGLFQTEEAAAEAYNKKAKRLHGEFANLNVIEAKTNIQCSTDQRNGRPGIRL